MKLGPNLVGGDKLTAGRRAEGATYLCLSGWSEQAYAEHPAYVIRGVRIPELSWYLVDAEVGDDWPLELRLLRAELKRTEQLEDALASCAAYPVLSVAWESYDGTQGRGEANWAWTELQRLAQGHPRYDVVRNEPDQTLTHVGDHIAQLSMQSSPTRCDQWYLFDDLWAAANQDLASSLIRHTQAWDPLS